MTLSAAPGSLRTLSIWLCCLGALAFNSPVLRAAGWLKINKEELAETKPKIDPEAGAEILVRNVVLDYSSIHGGSESHYTRAKIFSERGMKHFSLVKITCKPDEEVSAIAARTIKPDGTIIEVKSSDIHTREELRSSAGRVRSKTFAFPGLEPGVIVEYKYELTASNIRVVAPMVFQSSLPARLVRYKVAMLKPPPGTPINFDIRMISYNCPSQKLNLKDGYYTFEFTNQPAAKKEPYSPPDVMNLTSMLIYLSLSKDLPPADFWRHWSKELHKKYNSALKPTPEITAKATEIAAGADTPEDKVRKIYDWCRTSIVNRERDTTRLSAETRKTLKKNEGPADTLKTGIGTSLDINLLFVALARAAGLDARIASCNNRLKLLFNEKITEPRFILSDTVAAVQIGSERQYFDPGSTYLPPGQLRYSNTDTAILVSDPAGQESPVIVPGEPPEKNLVQRTANLRLNSGGTLEGDVTEIYSGQQDFELKNMLDDKSSENRAEYFGAKLTRQFKQARVTNIVVDNAADPLANTKVAYHIRIPRYAEKTGTRLFIQPAIFQRGGEPRISLPDGERKTPLIFPYRQQTKDEITIALPAGYSLEAASAPPIISVNGLGDHEIQLTLNRVTNTLTCRRDLRLTNISYKTTSYPSIKGIFAKVREHDDHTLTLKRDENSEAPDEAPEKFDEDEPKSSISEDNKSDMEFSP
jgi:hypothetical protein